VLIGEVFSNLLANAMRHTAAGGSITVEARPGPDRGTVEFVVEDTGTGIASEDLDHVFERFTKASDSRGAGLGLAIAKSLVEAHGGRIDAASRPGRGTVMRFVLPAAGSDA
jgi:two-component system, OmpR family, sensor histidine kinase BaeS